MLRHPKSLGLFPLHSVLLPGAMLSLRVFERRYLDLVSECTRDSRGFGVCLILIGDESGVPATPAKYGTQARIEDFTTGSDGLLHLRIRGGRRFRVDTTHVRDNGLLLADVDWCEYDVDDELRPEHATLGIVLQQIAEQVGGELAKAPPARFDEAAWVGWRLAELLPLQESQRQALLQIEDPHARLDKLLHWIA
jgi:Lon protease-like protein